ncbi:MAG: response regulator [Leptolyngbya sp. SIO1E4]|nr:response regulator [Leptolyngbya sp. SIO1E4]
MCRILIAEDEPRIAAFMQKGLRKAGFTPEVVHDGNAVLDKVLREKFELLLLDLGLPGKDGREVLTALRREGMNLPVVVVTALSIDPQDEENLRILASEVVNKPFLMRNLVQKVRSILGKSHDKP